MDFQTFGSIGTNSLTLLFTQYTTAWLAAISSHCLAVLPAKMSEFNIHMRKNTYCCKLKRTFQDLLTCNGYALKPNSRTIRSQVSAT